MAYSVETIGALLKTYYEPGLKKMFYNDSLLLKRLKKNRSDIHGGQAAVALHIGRNPGIGSIANAGVLPAAGKQTYTQCQIPLRYHYGRTWFSGPDISNSKNDKGAFARVLTSNLTGMLDDMRADMNRQLFADGSGVLAFCSTTAATAATAVIYPYLWSPAAKYLKTTGTRLEIYDISNGSTSNITAGYVTTSTGDNMLDFTSGTSGTLGGGDAVGKYGALQLGASTFTQYEAMGLDGIINDTNLLGDQYWQYDRANSVVSFTGPEGQSYDWQGPSANSYNNTLQGISAYTYDWWRSTVKGNGGVPRPLSLQMMDTMWGTLQTGAGAKTSLIMTTWQVAQKYADLLRADRRYVDTTTLDGGVKAVTYMGIPLAVDPDCPRGRMYFVDESQLSIYSGEDFGFVTDSNGNNLFLYTDSNGAYDMFSAIGRVYMNLGVHNRQKLGKIIDISET